MRRLVLVVSLLFLTFTLSFAASFTKEHKGGGVEVSLTLLNPQALYTGGDLIFDTSMNTHTIDLDRYQMEELSFLRDEMGRLFKALAWESAEGGGHHRFGRLKFPGKDNKGKPIIGKNDKYIEVVIRDVGGVKERVLKWELPFGTGI